MTSSGFTYGRQLSVRLDGTARVHTRCHNRPENGMPA